jgi:hypothetical protein
MIHYEEGKKWHQLKFWQVLTNCIKDFGEGITTQREKLFF